ncbi:MAG: dTMP kinase [Firmicutes bacterium]|nr:dTMP kinase [Bacillota bacterium]
MRGLFITVEGPDGSGKSTQVANIKKFFEDRGMDVVLSREPGGTMIGERIRNIILDKDFKEMDPMTEAMLYAASRSQHVAQVIAPALNEGKVVVCDRFVDSSLAYQGFGRNLGEPVAVINSYAVRGYMPDVTFLMKLDPAVGKHRIEESRAEQDRLEQEKLAFHKRVYEGFLELEKQHPERIVGIDASLPMDRIRDLIYDKLEELLG